MLGEEEVSYNITLGILPSPRRFSLFNSYNQDLSSGLFSATIPFYGFSRGTWYWVGTTGEVVRRLLG